MTQSDAATAASAAPAAASIEPDDLRAAMVILRKANGHRVGKRAHRSALELDLWRPLLEMIDESEPGHRPDIPGQYLKFHAARAHEPVAVDRLQRALLTAEIAIATQPDDPESDDEGKPQPFSLGLVGSASFARQVFERKWLIPGILVQGQPAIVGGPRKGMKTSTMVDLVISLGSVTRFLGEFVVPRLFKTMLISGESGDATIQETAFRVCEAKGIELEELEGVVHWGFQLPQLSNPEHMAVLAATIAAEGIEVVVIDPLYLCLLSGNSKLDAANLFDVGPLLSRITRVCLEAGATPILVHHLRKNREDPFSPPELEDLAYAGVQEFARQWFMIGRRAPYVPGSGEHALWLSVGGSAGHSGAWAVDVSEGIVDEEFASRKWNVRVTKATDARNEAKARTEAAKADRAHERVRERDEISAKRVRADADAALLKLEKLGAATKTAWKSAMLTWDSKRFNSAVAHLLDCKLVEPAQVASPAGKGTAIRDGFRPLPIPSTIPFPKPGLNPDEPGLNPDNPALIPGTSKPGFGESLPPVGGDSTENPGMESGIGENTLAVDTGCEATHQTPGLRSQGERKP